MKHCIILHRYGYVICLHCLRAFSETPCINRLRVIITFNAKYIFREIAQVLYIYFTKTLLPQPACLSEFIAHMI